MEFHEKTYANDFFLYSNTSMERPSGCRLTPRALNTLATINSVWTNFESVKIIFTFIFYVEQPKQLKIRRELNCLCILVFDTWQIIRCPIWGGHRTRWDGLGKPQKKETQPEENCYHWFLSSDFSAIHFTKEILPKKIQASWLIRVLTNGTKQKSAPSFGYWIDGLPSLDLAGTLNITSKNPTSSRSKLIWPGLGVFLDLLSSLPQTTFCSSCPHSLYQFYNHSCCIWILVFYQHHSLNNFTVTPSTFFLLPFLDRFLFFFVILLIFHI